MARSTSRRSSWCAAAAFRRGPRGGDVLEHAFHLLLILRRDHPPPDAAQTAPVIDGLVPRDGQQPGLEARVAAEGVEPPERHQKRVLRGIFRVRMRAQRREGGPIDRRPVPFDQLAKGGRVPLPGPRDQVDVAHTDCRHTGGVAGWGGPESRISGWAGRAGFRSLDGRMATDTAGVGRSARRGADRGRQSDDPASAERSVSDRLDDRFHVHQVLLERAPAGGGETVFRPRDAAVERLFARDVFGILELPRVDAQIAVGRLQEAL